MYPNCKVYNRLVHQEPLLGLDNNILIIYWIIIISTRIKYMPLSILVPTKKGNYQERKFMLSQ